MKLAELRKLAGPKSLRSDGMAGLVLGVESVPDDGSAPEDPADTTEAPVREPAAVPAWTWVVGLLILLAAIIGMVRGSGAGSGGNTTGQ